MVIILKAKIPTLICTNYCYVPNMLCKDLNFVPEIALHFDERYKFAIAFSSVEDDVYFGRQVKDSCYVEIYDVGDTDVFQIGDPFFKEYYTVFSANNNTMGFGLSIRETSLMTQLSTIPPLRLLCPGPCLYLRLSLHPTPYPSFLLRLTIHPFPLSSPKESARTWFPWLP